MPPGWLPSTSTGIKVWSSELTSPVDGLRSSLAFNGSSGSSLPLDTAKLKWRTGHGYRKWQFEQGMDTYDNTYYIHRRLRGHQNASCCAACDSIPCPTGFIQESNTVLKILKLKYHSFSVDWWRMMIQCHLSSKFQPHLHHNSTIILTGFIVST